MSQLAPEQWAEVRRLFEQAGRLPPEAQGGFLERECANEDLRREVQSLLEYSATDLGTAAGAIAAEAAAVAREADPDERLIGTHLGPYKIEAIAGHGGMGAVYSAVRDDGEFRQQVAIKLVRAAAQSPATLQRFKQERQILARLAHPNIARLLDGGSTSDAIPYLVMEFIQGEAITAWCERQSLPMQQRLRLFLSVCDGVEFAHRNLVVHRDLKPANILVTAEGVPKLLDFGIAKMLAPDANGAAATTLGAAAMTPEYAAPEQVRGDPVSKAVDVYALGLVFYEMLTGRRAQEMPDYTPATVARVVCQSEPPAPVACKPELAGDLDNIIRMALRKEPARRYGSAAELAQDIRRHQEGRPVLARPDTPSYRAAKFLRRNQAALAGAVVTGILFGAASLAYWLTKPGRVPRVLRVTQITQSGHVGIGGNLAAIGRYVYFIERNPGRWMLARAPAEGGSAELLHTPLDYAEIMDSSPDGTRLLVSNGVGDDVPLWIVPVDGSQPSRIGNVAARTAAWSPDGKRIVFGHESALYTVAIDGSGLRKLLDTPAKPYAVRWGLASRGPVLRYALASSRERMTLWEVGLDGTRARPLLPHWDSNPGFSADDTGSWTDRGRYYLFRSIRTNTYSLWAIKEGGQFFGLLGPHPVLIHSVPGGGLFSPTPTRDGKRVFFISGAGRSQFVRYDRRRREFVPFLPGTAGHSLSFSPDGRWVAYTIGAPIASLWRSRPDGSQAMRLTPPAMHVYGSRWSPDGSWIAFGAKMAGQPDAAYVIPSDGGSPEKIDSSASDATSGNPSWSTDSRSVLFRRDAPSGGGLYIMDWQTRKMSLLPQSERRVFSAWSPDARYISASDGKQIQLFDLRIQRWLPLARGQALGPMFWSRNGKYIYFQDQFEAEQPIFRASIPAGKIERMMTSRQIPQSDLTTYLLSCLAPDDSPVASVGRSNAEIYALDLELP